MMFRFARGRRPDITPVQLLAAVPLVIALLAVVGVFELSDAELEALNKAVQLAFALLIADAVIRIGRNISGGRSELADEIEGGDLLLRPPTEEELAEAERLEAESSILDPPRDRAPA